MLKTASIYRLADLKQLDGLEDKLDREKFLPVEAPNLKSFGWGEVREGALCLRSHGHLLLKLTIESKVIPPSALKRAIAAKCDELEKVQGFAPGKKQRAEVKEHVLDELAARALTKLADTKVWIDTVRGRVVIDSAVVGTLDIIIKLLTHLGLDLTYHASWAGGQMNYWLLGKDGDNVMPDDYTIDDAIQMEYPGERGTTVAFKKAELEAHAVQMHAQAGAIVTAMAMTYKSRVSFTLLPTHQLKGIRLLDIVKENQVAQDADAFENDFVLTALELQMLIDDLTAAP